jgi:hypothetical protein
MKRGNDRDIGRVLKAFAEEAENDALPGEAEALQRVRYRIRAAARNTAPLTRRAPRWREMPLPIAVTAGIACSCLLRFISPELFSRLALALGF